MKTLQVVLIAIGVALVVLVIGDFFDSSGLERRQADGQDDSAAAEPGSGTGNATAESPNAIMPPPWVRRLSERQYKNPKWRGYLAKYIGEMEALCIGKTNFTSNTMAVKACIAKLYEDMKTMSQAEKDALANYFDNCEVPAMKFHLAIAFGRFGDGTFVKSMEGYYHEAPEDALEALKYLNSREDDVVKSFERLYDGEIDPVRRARIIQSSVAFGRKEAEPFLMRAYNMGAGSVERRAAVTGLVRLGNEEGAKLVDEILAGEYEEAGYGYNESRMDYEGAKDLRCQAVIARLVNGRKDEVMDLLSRIEKPSGDGQVAEYATEFLLTLQDNSFVTPVVDLIVKTDNQDPRLFRYLAARAKAGDIEQLRRLQRQPLSEDLMRMIEDTINRNP